MLPDLRLHTAGTKSEILLIPIPFPDYKKLGSLAAVEVWFPWVGSTVLKRVKTVCKAMKWEKRDQEQLSDYKITGRKVSLISGTWR